MIRQASKFDNDYIIDLLIEYQNINNHAQGLDRENWSREFVHEKLNKIHAGAGFVLVDDELNGVLCAVKSPSFWVKNTFILQEALWYARSSKLALKLLKEYIKIGKELIRDGLVSELHFSSYGNANFNKLGAKQESTHWII
jgi:hypothetical protein